MGGELPRPRLLPEMAFAHPTRLSGVDLRRIRAEDHSHSILLPESLQKDDEYGRWLTCPHVPLHFPLLPRANSNVDSEHHSNWVHRWTLSRHLWEADSAFQFTRIWKETPQFVIKNFSFDHFLEYGTCDDVDEFAEIILSA